MPKKALSRHEAAVLSAFHAFKEFAQKYGSELKGAGLEKILAKAAEDGNADVFSLALQFWLDEIGVKPPKGVFMFSLHVDRPGRRPKMLEALDAWSLYNEMPQGKRSLPKVAEKLYPADYARDPKNAADKVGRLIRGLYEKSNKWLATKNAKKISE